MNAEFDESALKLRLYCLGNEWGFEHSKLELEFCPGDDGELAGVLSIKIGPLDIGFRFWSTGFELENFRQDLIRVGKGEKTEAVFTDIIHHAIVLRLREDPSPNRVIEITGHVSLIAPDYSYAVPFAGFRTESSLLPDVARCIRDFLTVTQVSTKNPLLDL
jgi:hypothetical protein